MHGMLGANSIRVSATRNVTTMREHHVTLVMFFRKNVKINSREIFVKQKADFRITFHDMEGIQEHHFDAVKCFFMRK